MKNIATSGDISHLCVHILILAEENDANQGDFVEVPKKQETYVIIIRLIQLHYVLYLNNQLVAYCLFGFLNNVFLRLLLRGAFN